jgi:hypothetical protein
MEEKEEVTYLESQSGSVKRRPGRGNEQEMT